MSSGPLLGQTHCYQFDIEFIEFTINYTIRLLSSDNISLVLLFQSITNQSQQCNLNALWYVVVFVVKTLYEIREYALNHIVW